MEEEEAAPAISNPIQDPTLQKKHQSMLDRLSTRHQTRLENSVTTKSKSSLESTSSFISRFSHLKNSIDSQLTTTTTDPTHLKSLIASISPSISALEKLVAENSYYLPSYEVRSSLKTISDLKQNLENLNSKKKFSFKNKSTTKKESPITEAPKSDAVSRPKNSIIRVDSPGFRDRENQLLVENLAGLDTREFTLSNLDSCEVRLIGTCSAVFVNKLRNCRVYVGPVKGSILIDEVEECVFVMASHQIRIHRAKRSDFYLRVRSRPIIEDIGDVRFAPYCLEYQGIEEDLKKASLEEETGNWCNVDDFKWLRAVQSPNWSVLPQDQRTGSVKLSTF
ncbi:TBCC domain-containing protein [Cephalotus follicularis]|uniref:TBCC domain-containing protein n=1 Tax=Cephalotus follicularis TaxID=3775 RepID=A0A1Q3D7W8_CEPFO|nr:TBCC domain-containing protein [Cephalotus follicularis]